MPDDRDKNYQFILRRVAAVFPIYGQERTFTNWSKIDAVNIVHNIIITVCVTIWKEEAYCLVLALCFKRGKCA